MADTASFDVTLFLKTKHVFDLKLHEGRSMQNASYNSKRGSVEKVGVRALAAPVSDIRNQLIS